MKKVWRFKLVTPDGGLIAYERMTWAQADARNDVLRAQNDTRRWIPAL